MYIYNISRVGTDLGRLTTSTRLAGAAFLPTQMTCECMKSKASILLIELQSLVTMLQGIWVRPKGDSDVAKKKTIIISSVHVYVVIRFCI